MEKVRSPPAEAIIYGWTEALVIDQSCFVSWDDTKTRAASSAVHIADFVYALKSLLHGTMNHYNVLRLSYLGFNMRLVLSFAIHILTTAVAEWVGRGTP